MKKYRTLILRTIRNLSIISLIIWYCVANTNLSILIVLVLLAILADLLEILSKKDPHLYLRLYRGCAHPAYPPTEEHEMGPIIGPIEITAVFGEIYIHDPETPDDMKVLPETQEGDYILFEGVYYSDFEILSASSPDLKHHRKQKERFLTFKQFTTSSQKLKLIVNSNN